MNTYYRLIKLNGNSDFTLNQLPKKWLAVPYPFYNYTKRYNQFKNIHNYYCWFTEEWFNYHVRKTLRKNQYIVVLKTTTEPAYLDGKQAMFKYKGNEKVNNIKITRGIDYET